MFQIPGQHKHDAHGLVQFVPFQACRVEIEAGVGQHLEVNLSRPPKLSSAGGPVRLLDELAHGFPVLSRRGQRSCSHRLGNAVP